MDVHTNGTVVITHIHEFITGSPCIHLLLLLCIFYEEVEILTFICDDNEFSLAGCLEDDSADDTSVVEPVYTEYSFTGQDSDPAITSSNDDELIELTRTEDTGDDLNWAILVVSAKFQLMPVLGLLVTKISTEW